MQNGWAFLIGKPQRPDGTGVERAFAHRAQPASAFFARPVKGFVVVLIGIQLAVDLRFEPIAVDRNLIEAMLRRSI